MPTIENFATVRYTSGGVQNTTVSNLAEIDLASSVSLTKVPLTDAYEDGSSLTYILTVQNNSTPTLTDLSITDDLGTFTYEEASLTPLTYSGDAVLLINGQDASPLLTVDASNPASLIFNVSSLSAGQTANVIYSVSVNRFAPLSEGSTIVNTATLTAASECAEGTATATVTVASLANVSVFKQMSPNPVVCGNLITYSIRIYNYGNVPAEDVQLTDTFDPAPTNVTVTRDGIALLTTEYTYVDGVLTVPTADAQGDTIPAATYTRDDSGALVVTPGMVEYVITGTI